MSASHSVVSMLLRELGAITLPPVRPALGGHRRWPGSAGALLGVLTAQVLAADQADLDLYGAQGERRTHWSGEPGSDWISQLILLARRLPRARCTSIDGWAGAGANTTIS
jgi:hypothetical protein